MTEAVFPWLQVTLMATSSSWRGIGSTDEISLLREGEAEIMKLSPLNKWAIMIIKAVNISEADNGSVLSLDWNILYSSSEKINSIFRKINPNLNWLKFGEEYFEPCVSFLTKNENQHRIEEIHSNKATLKMLWETILSYLVTIRQGEKRSMETQNSSSCRERNSFIQCAWAECSPFTPFQTSEWLSGMIKTPSMGQYKRF